jgi:hypothetical protein
MHLVLPIVVIVVLCATPSAAQMHTTGRVIVSLEGLVVTQQRNDVRIPPDTGSEFSIVDLIGSAPTGTIRVEVVAGLTERQELRFVYAPLRLTGGGTPADPIAFAGVVFAPLPTDAEYKFSSYRGTWRFRVYQGPTWTWHAGVTGFVRDARVALSQPGQSAEDTDVGFVPLGHLHGHARVTDQWHVNLVLDASAAPQGRAIDFAATANYRPTPRWTVSLGYRTVEGGADVDTVYAFAWLNAVVAGIGVRF